MAKSYYDKSVELYLEWAKKNNLEGAVPFCAQDTWAGHLVKNFADFIVYKMSSNPNLAKEEEKR